MGFEVAIGFLIAWAAAKARRVLNRADGTVDEALDAAVDRVGALITRKLHGDPAVERLQLEAAAGEVSTLTKENVAQALETATSEDPDFARELKTALAGVTVKGDVRAKDSGIAIGGISGGTVYINPR